MRSCILVPIAFSAVAGCRGGAASMLDDTADATDASADDGVTAGPDAGPDGDDGVATTAAGNTGDTDDSNDDTGTDDTTGAPPIDPATFPLHISDDTHHLVDAAGEPFLIRGDSAWSLAVELDEAEALAYLDDRAARGFNTILFNLIEPAFSSHDPKWANAAGQVPFSDPNDFTALEEPYFEHIDWLLAEAESRGILVLLTPAYIGYDCGAEGWCAAMQANGVDNLLQYGTWVGQRYADTPNIIWVEGGDHTPSTDGDPSQMDLVVAVAQGIEAGDRGAHYHVAHWSSGTSGADVQGIPWLDIDTTYTYSSPHLYVKLASDYERDAGVRPLFLFESSYENEHQTSGLQLRAQMYQPVLSGGAGFLFGNYPIWGFWDPGDPGWFLDDGGFPRGWASALGSHGAVLAQIAGDLFSSRPWEDLRPDTGNTILVGGYGVFGSDDYALLASTPDHAVSIVYTTAMLDLMVDLGAMPGPVTARWFDPADATAQEVRGSPFAATGTMTFTPPGANADGEPDWLLLLDAAP